MFHHFIKSGQIYTTDYQIAPENCPELEGVNYSSRKLAKQAWKSRAINYLEYCFILAAPSKIPYGHEAE